METFTKRGHKGCPSHVLHYKLITNNVNVPFSHLTVIKKLGVNNNVLHAKHQLHCFLDQSVQPFSVCKMGSFFNLHALMNHAGAKCVSH